MSGIGINLFDVLSLQLFGVSGAFGTKGPSLAERELAIESCPCEFAGQVLYCPRARLDGLGDDVRCAHADEAALDAWAQGVNNGS